MIILLALLVDHIRLEPQIVIKVPTMCLRVNFSIFQTLIAFLFVNLELSWIIPWTTLHCKFFVYSSIAVVRAMWSYDLDLPWFSSWRVVCVPVCESVIWDSLHSNVSFFIYRNTCYVFPLMCGQLHLMKFLLLLIVYYLSNLSSFIHLWIDKPPSDGCWKSHSWF